MIEIKDGKLLLRQVSDKDHVVVGVIAMPVETEGETIMPVILTDGGLAAFVDDIKKPEADLRHTSPSGIYSKPVFHRGVKLGAMQLYLRNTSLPDAPEGMKWMIAVGPSCTLRAGSRIIHIEDGDTYIKIDELYEGLPAGDVLQVPLWGNPKNPCMISFPLDPALFEEVMAEDDALSMSVEGYAEFRDAMNARFERKTWYTEKEARELREAAQSLMVKHVRNPGMRP
jgi:hypothetical protein